jgi:serine/threonine protein kinase
MSYLHSKGIVHRDIKPENFLIYSQSGKISIKLIDFGFSAFCREGHKLSDRVGSLQYIAPEILQDEEYEEAVDMWACGVVLYNMITGKQPFFGKIDSDLIHNILTQEVSYNENIFKNINCKVLCQGLLEKDPKARFTAHQARTSIWIQNYISKDLEPTRDARFQPKTENIKSIMDILNQQSNVKAELWALLLEHLDLDISENIIQVMNKNSSQQESDGSIGGIYTITYEKFILDIIKYPNVDSQLVTSLKSNDKFF